MKKMIFAALVAAIVSTAAPAMGAGVMNKPMGEKGHPERSARRKERSDLPDAFTASRFAADFPGATLVHWTQGRFTEAEFVEAGVSKTAYYDADHSLLGTTENVGADQLPEKAFQVIRRQYPGYTIRGVVFFHDNTSNDTDMGLFNSAFPDEDNYFPFLQKGDREVILRVNPSGEVHFFEQYH